MLKNVIFFGHIISSVHPTRWTRVINSRFNCEIVTARKLNQVSRLSCRQSENETLDMIHIYSYDLSYQLILTKFFAKYKVVWINRSHTQRFILTFSGKCGPQSRNLIQILSGYNCFTFFYPSLGCEPDAFGIQVSNYEWFHYKIFQTFELKVEWRKFCNFILTEI